MKSMKFHMCHTYQNHPYHRWHQRKCKGRHDAKGHGISQVGPYIPECRYEMCVSPTSMWQREVGVAPCRMVRVKVLLEMEGRGVLQRSYMQYISRYRHEVSEGEDLIPNVEQLELAYIPVKVWIMDSDVHSLLDSTSG